MPETVAEATAAAEAAQAEYLRVQDAALHGEPGQRPEAAEVLQLAKAAELAQQRIPVARQREEREREDARRAALEQLGTEVDGFYAEAAASTALADAARSVTESVAALRAAVAAHNGRVRGYEGRAAALGTRPGVRGPRPEDAYVGHGGGIRHRHLAVREVGANELSYAVSHAVAGDLDKAVAELRTTHDHSPRPPRQAWRDKHGILGVIPVYGGGLPSDMASMIGEGRLVKLSDEEVATWWASRPQ